MKTLNRVFTTHKYPNQLVHIKLQQIVRINDNCYHMLWNLPHGKEQAVTESIRKAKEL